MKEIAETMDQAKKYALMFVEVPPHAYFEIRWAEKEPHNLEDPAAFDGRYVSGGPMLIACLTD
jgi:hypothetical protein